MLEVRSKEEKLRLGAIRRANAEVVKKNKKQVRKKRSPLPLLDETPHNAIIGFGLTHSTGTHGNNALHLVILRHESRRMLEILLDADKPGKIADRELDVEKLGPGDQSQRTMRTPKRRLMPTH